MLSIRKNFFDTFCYWGSFGVITSECIGIRVILVEFLDFSVKLY